MKIPTYEDISLTEKWIRCDNCNHTGKAKVGADFDFGIQCTVCRKEGCIECIDMDDTFWNGNKKYYHHKLCPWTDTLIKLKKEADHPTERVDSRYERGGEFNCGRDCS